MACDKRERSVCEREHGMYRAWRATRERGVMACDRRRQGMPDVKVQVDRHLHLGISNIADGYRIWLGICIDAYGICIDAICIDAYAYRL